jgi:hypothetical protein
MYAAERLTARSKGNGRVSSEVFRGMYLCTLSRFRILQTVFPIISTFQKPRFCQVVPSSMHGVGQHAKSLKGKPAYRRRRLEQARARTENEASKRAACSCSSGCWPARGGEVKKERCRGVLRTVPPYSVRYRDKTP